MPTGQHIRTREQRDSTLEEKKQALKTLYVDRDKEAVGSARRQYFNKKIYAVREAIRFLAGSATAADLIFRELGHPALISVVERWRTGAYWWWKEGGGAHKTAKSKQSAIRTGMAIKSKYGLSYLSSIQTLKEREIALKTAMVMLSSAILDRSHHTHGTPEYNRYAGQMQAQRERVRFLSGDLDTAIANVKKCGGKVSPQTAAKWSKKHYWKPRKGESIRANPASAEAQDYFANWQPPEAESTDSIRREGLEREQERERIDAERREYLRELDRKRKLRGTSKTGNPYF